MTTCALITGASSGIGRELARLHAARGGNVILTARRGDALDSLKAELEAAHGVAAHVFALDLGEDGAAERLHNDIGAAGLDVDILINNAGFGGHGVHIERALDAERAMIDLNVKSLVALTHLIANDMLTRGGGKILNVGSTAGFMPGPQQAVYFATKAFVNSFSQAIDHELRGKGVTCTVLAPGYVETGFADAADLGGTDLVSGNSATAESVARIGYEAMLRGDLVAINEARLRFLTGWVIPLLPRRMVLNIVDRMQTK